MSPSGEASSDAQFTCTRGSALDAERHRFPDRRGSYKARMAPSWQLAKVDRSQSEGALHFLREHRPQSRSDR